MDKLATKLEPKNMVFTPDTGVDNFVDSEHKFTSETGVDYFVDSQNSKTRQSRPILHKAKPSSKKNSAQQNASKTLYKKGAPLPAQKQTEKQAYNSLPVETGLQPSSIKTSAAQAASALPVQEETFFQQPVLEQALAPAVKGSAAAVTEKKKPSKAKKILSDIVFFALIIAIIFGVFLYKQSTQQSTIIFGHSFYTVLTESMQSVIPKGSLVVVKQTPGAELAVGDDITFMRDAETVVTHRIMAVEPNYEESGSFAFVTKGVDNYMADEGAVREENVIGKVIKVFPSVGIWAGMLYNNIKWIIILLVLLFILVLSIRVFLPAKNTDEAASHKSTEDAPQKRKKSKRTKV